MKHGSLFSGIGGFDIAAEWCGWTNVFQVEIDSFCQKVLAKNFPNIKRYDDIKKFDGTKYRGDIDIISGGFPCQPVSVAGKRKGKSDDRWLWPEMLRIIREIKPTWVVAENVAGITSMENGETLEGILVDLEDEGYQIQPYLIPACGVEAWHRRERIWIIAYNGSRNTWCRDESKQAKMRRHEPRQNPKTSSSFSRQNNSGGISKRELETTRTLEDASNTDNKRLEGRNSKELQECTEQWVIRKGDTQDVSNTTGKRQQRQGESKQPSNPEEVGEGKTTIPFDGSGQDIWSVESELGGMVTRLPPELDGYWETEPDIPRVATGIKDRENRLKGLGNTVVPQVVYEIFETVDIIEKNNPCQTKKQTLRFQ